jgi:hypothetical protein
MTKTLREGTKGMSRMTVTAEPLLSDVHATISDPAEVLERARERGVQFSADEFFTLCVRAGRVEGPWLLRRAWGLRVISPETVTASIAMVWSMVEFPQKALERRDWLRLFRVAGFTIDGNATERPGEPVRLYRGCVPRRRTGFSWSANRDMAEWFAARFSAKVGTSPAFRSAFVYETEAPPEALLCIPGEAGRPREAEYVIDASGLDIRPAGELPRSLDEAYAGQKGDADGER